SAPSVPSTTLRTHSRSSSPAFPAFTWCSVTHAEKHVGSSAAHAPQHSTSASQATCPRHSRHTLVQRPVMHPLHPSERVGSEHELGVPSPPPVPPCSPAVPDIPEPAVPPMGSAPPPEKPPRPPGVVPPRSPVLASAPPEEDESSTFSYLSRPIRLAQAASRTPERIHQSGRARLGESPRGLIRSSPKFQRTQRSRRGAGESRSRLLPPSSRRTGWRR